jgi:hypothetical protein
MLRKLAYILISFKINGILDTSLRVNKSGRVCLRRDEESLVLEGFPLIHCNSVWMLVPYTEMDPLWEKVAWDEAIPVGGALSISFMIENLEEDL